MTEETRITIASADAKALAVAQDHTADFVIRAEALKVVDQDTLVLAGTLKDGGNALLKEIDSIFDKPKKTAKAAHQAAVDAWKGQRIPIESGVTKIKNEIGTFHRLERRRVQEAEAAEADRLRKIEEERRLEAAVRAEEKGDSRTADEILETPAATRAPIITTPPPTKAANVTIAKIRKAKVTNLHKLAAYAVEHPEHLYLFDVPDAKINALSRANKQLEDGDELLPGLVVVIEDQVR